MSYRGLVLSLLTAIVLHWLLIWGFTVRSGTGVNASRDLRPPSALMAVRIVQIESVTSAREQPLNRVDAVPVSEQSKSDVQISVNRETHRSLERRLDRVNESAEQARQRPELPEKVPEIAASATSQVSNQLGGTVDEIVNCVNEQGQRFTVFVPHDSIFNDAASNSQSTRQSEKRDPCDQG